MLVGRDLECTALERLLAVARSGTSGAIVISGEAGVGKSALLDFVADRAADGGMRLLRARGVPSEVTVPFAGLLSLLRPTLDQLDRIPTRQREAIESALALTGGIAEGYAVAAGTLSLLALVAHDRPLAILIDDANHIDPASRAAIMFAVRRLQADPIATVLTVRSESGGEIDAADITWLEIGRLGVDEARLLARTILGQSRIEDVERLVHSADGNPLALIELARAGVDGGPPRNRGSRVVAEFARRADSLSPDAGHLALLVAASDDDGLGAAIRASRIDDPAAAIAELEAAGLARSTGASLRFVHPLARALAYERVTPAQRRAAHAALAGSLEGPLVIERRAWHLAAAAIGPDAVVADGLDVAARSALGRGAPGAAASAYQRAAALSPDRSVAADRALAGADAAHRSGDLDLATSLLDFAASRDESGRLEARREQLRGHILARRGDVQGAFEALTTAASALGEADRRRSVMLLTSAAESAAYRGNEAVLDTADRIGRLANADDGTEAFCAALTIGRALSLTGNWAAGQPHLERASARIDAGEVELDEHIAGWMGSEWLSASQTGLGHLERLVAQARENGDVGTLPFRLRILASRRVFDRRFAEAASLADEATELARATGQLGEEFRGRLALVQADALLGREDGCRVNAARLIERPNSLDWVVATAQLGLAELDLALGRVSDAIAGLEKGLAFVGEGFRRPRWWPALELAEALARSGHEERASDLIARVSLTSVPRDAIDLARVRGLLVADGELDGVFGLLPRIGDEPGLDRRDRDPLALARTRLAYGERLRRAGRRVDAREQLAAAADGFHSIGAQAWLNRAEAELRATGAHPRPRASLGRDNLTPQELRVALAADSGATNREIADGLFLSVKTVEYHLRNVYGKLGIASRRELGPALALRP